MPHRASPGPARRGDGPAGAQGMPFAWALYAARVFPLAHGPHQPRRLPFVAEVIVEAARAGVFPVGHAIEARQADVALHVAFGRAGREAPFRMASNSASSHSRLLRGCRGSPGWRRVPRCGPCSVSRPVASRCFQRAPRPVLPDARRATASASWSDLARMARASAMAFSTPSAGALRRTARARSSVSRAFRSALLLVVIEGGAHHAGLEAPVVLQLFVRLRIERHPAFVVLFHARARMQGLVKVLFKLVKSRADLLGDVRAEEKRA